MNVISRLQVQRYKEKGIRKSEKRKKCFRHKAFLTYIKKIERLPHLGQPLFILHSSLN